MTRDQNLQLRDNENIELDKFVFVFVPIEATFSDAKRNCNKSDLSSDLSSNFTLLLLSFFLFFLSFFLSFFLTFTDFNLVPTKKQKKTRGTFFLHQFFSLFASSFNFWFFEIFVFFLAGFSFV